MLGGSWPELVFGVALGLILVVARLVTVPAVLIGSHLRPLDTRVVAILAPRGLAAGVLATFPIAAGVREAEAIPTIVHAAAITTIVAFAVAPPLVRGRAPRVEADAKRDLAHPDASGD